MGQTESTAKGTVAEPEQEPVNILLSEKVFTRLTREPDSAMKKTEMKTNPEPARATSAHYMQGSTSAPDLYQLDNPAVADQESELTKNKNYWKKRLENLQQTQEKIKVILEEESKRGFEDAQASLTSGSPDSTEKPCADNLGTVADCYKSNAKEPLTCDKEVTEFVTCLKTARMEMLKPKEESEEEENLDGKTEEQSSEVKKPGK